MKREEAKLLLPIIKAFSEGKVVQQKCAESWVRVDEDCDFHFPASDYRIKPEPKYRPFKNEDECWGEMLKHQPFGWLKAQGQRRLITRMVGTFFQLDRADDLTKFKEGVQWCKFVDGTPFGVKEE